MQAVVVLAGGTGGAKLARGMLDVVGPGELVVVANTADDIVVHGAHVSPDPDLCAFHLADLIDERGWGIRDDTFAVMDALRTLGAEAWFKLGDRDLALGLERARSLARGERLTQACARLFAALGVPGRVLPMCDEPVRTEVDAHGRSWPFQEFMILGAGRGPVDAVRFAGIESARPTPEVLEAIAGARAIVIGPSNPVISIGPILALPGMLEALAAAPARVVAVSPIVGGRVLKGPTEPFMASAGYELSGQGIADAYAGVIDAIVADEPVSGLPALRTDTLMVDPAGAARLAREVLGFAEAL